MITYDFAAEVTRFKKAYSEIFKTEPHFVVAVRSYRHVPRRFGVTVTWAVFQVDPVTALFQA